MYTRFAQGQTTLPQKYFLSAEVFAEESEHIFAQSWICVGRASQLSSAGSYFLANILQQSIIVTRDSSDCAQAYYNVCRHRGTQLCTETEGTFTGKIQCPYHMWTYSLSGDLTGAPNMKDVPGFDRSKYPLQKVSIAEWEGFLFLNLSQNPQAFEESFGTLMNRFHSWQLSDLQIAKKINY
jgi:Rieske 2Fe-2S family protein